MLDITVQLNTNITNEISDARVVKLEALAETGRPWLPGWRNYVEWPGAHHDRFYHRRRRTVMADMFGDGELSDDGDAIEWTGITTDGRSI